MSVIQTITSDTRPAVPVEGALFYETDTNRLLLFANSSFHVYNRDSLTQSQGGVDELHYPQGIFSSTTATYSLTTSPALHLDASYPNGITNEFTYTLDDYNQTPSGYIKYWADRTQNRHVFKEVQPGTDAYFDFDKSASLSNNACNAPCILGNLFKQVGSTNDPNTDLATNYPNGTVFYVGMPKNTTYPFIRPFVHKGNADFWLRGSYGQGEKYRVGTGNSNIEMASDYSYPGSSGLGPYLGICRFDVDNSLSQEAADNLNLRTLKMWMPTKDPFTHANGVVVSNSSPCKEGTATDAWEFKFASEEAFLVGYGTGTDQDYWWEVLVFPTALNIADINTVKDYLQNKYAGLHDQYLPVTGPTVALTESA